MIARGTFASVYMCTIEKTQKIVAVKRLKQDKKFKSRELQIHKELFHQNIIKIQHAFFSNETALPDDAMLNIVMDLIPSNVFKVITYFKRLKNRVM